MCKGKLTLSVLLLAVHLSAHSDSNDEINMVLKWNAHMSAKAATCYAFAEVTDLRLSTSDYLISQQQLTSTKIRALIRMFDDSVAKETEKELYLGGKRDPKGDVCKSFVAVAIRARRETDKKILSQ
jgi:hypothetical protein